MTRFWNNLIGCAQNRKNAKPNNLKSLGAKKPKGLTG